MTDDDKPKDDRPFHVRMSEALQRNRPPKPRNSPQLTHAGRCQVYALLYDGQRPDVVARLFGISHATVSHIGGCRNDNRVATTFEMTPGHTETLGGPTIKHRNNNRKPRYQEVAAEFETLGEDEFKRRYFTESLWDRLQRTKNEMKGEYRQNRLDKGLSL